MGRKGSRYNLEEQHHYILGVKRLVDYVSNETAYYVSHGKIRCWQKSQ